MSTDENIINEQIELSKRVIVFDNGHLQPRFVGGVDISYKEYADNRTVACAALTVFAFGDLKFQDVYYYTTLVEEEYTSGFLSVREGPIILSLLKKCTFVLDILFVDGHGILHPRKAGLASYIGVHANIVTIGIGKTRLLFDGVNYSGEFQKYSDGSPADIAYVEANGYHVGAALRSSEYIRNPIYVSPGHMITLRTCIFVTTHCFCRNANKILMRIPEPLRMADILSRAQLRQRHIIETLDI